MKKLFAPLLLFLALLVACGGSEAPTAEPTDIGTTGRPQLITFHASW